MSSQGARDRLRQATKEAQARRDRMRGEIERREEESPRPGDLLGLAETAEHTVLWAVLECVPSSAPQRCLLVAADLHPWVGSSDVAVPSDAPSGALSLRCGFEAWLDVAALVSARTVGRLDSEILNQARRKRAQVEMGAVTGSVLERETDDDLEYQDWLEEGPAVARAVLLESLGGEEASGTSAVGTDAQIYVNGIDAVSGDYLMPALSASEVAAWAGEESVDPSVLNLLRQVHRVSSQPHLGPGESHLRDVAQAGWGVVFHSEESSAVKDALQPLLEHRQAEVGEAKFRVLDYQPGEGWLQWLARHGVAAGRVQPAKLPYYLLLIGSPTRIPYDFQLLLGLEYAVGRLSFETVEDFRLYAQSVVEQEFRPLTLSSPKAIFFAPRHAFDPIARWNADTSVEPLVDHWPEMVGETLPSEFLMEKLWGEAATRTRLKAAFHSSSDAESPTLVFSAAHGLSWPPTHPQQRLLQGALLCQDWPGLGQLDPDRHAFTAADLSDEARVHGMIAFLQSAYSAGTPEWSTVPSEASKPTRIAAEPFVASLPQRLLSHPQGGAAAVIGRLDHSFLPAMEPDRGPHSLIREALYRLLAGWPVGHVVQELKIRYAALATRLEELRQKIALGARIDEKEVAALWGETRDARSFVVVGDPAVRLRGQRSKD